MKTDLYLDLHFFDRTSLAGCQTGLSAFAVIKFISNLYKM